LATATWQDVSLPLNLATVSITWGNPEGNLMLDLQAIQKIDLGVAGMQGDGRICIKEIRFGAQ